jgi:molecular chaperone HtpG
VLQRIVSALDEFVSLRLASRPESNVSTYFVNWVAHRRRFDLCSNLRVRVEPGDSATLDDIRQRSQASALLVYAGADPVTIRHASQERPLIILSHQSPRRDCELNFLRQYCRIEELTDNPKVLKEKPASDCTLAESALAFRIGAILSTDYFLAVEVKYGSITHGLPILVNRRASPVEIYLDPSGQSVRLLADLYEREYGAFGHMAKDFVRTVIFP